VRAPATADLHSLLGFGFPQGIVDAWAGAIPGLNLLQLDAINQFGLLDGQHLVVSAPTSSGKTMIGELAALRGMLDRRRALFLLPLKALVNDKYQEFRRKYALFGTRVIRATGDIDDDIPDLMRGRFDLCLMTYEKAPALLIGNPHLLDQIGTVVVDEVQMIADPSRGANLEFLLTLLRIRRGDESSPQVIGLSAVVGDTNGLERWLGARLLRREERPVPLEEGVLTAHGRFRYIDPDDGQDRSRPCIQPEWRKGSSQDLIIPLLRRLTANGEQVIVFRVTKSETVHVASYLARELGLVSARNALEA
jgi:helicase